LAATLTVEAGEEIGAHGGMLARTPNQRKTYLRTHMPELAAVTINATKNWADYLRAQHGLIRFN
jgi:hypothetical protein